MGIRLFVSILYSEIWKSAEGGGSGGSSNNQTVLLEDELSSRQNFIYTVDRHKAVFSSEHLIALKVGVSQSEPNSSSFRNSDKFQLIGKFRFLNKS